MGTEYTQQFYGDIAEGCRRSAAVVVPRVLKGYDIETVLDVGCGQGWWGAEFRRHGCRVTGLDGAYAAPPEGNLDSFVAHDLTQSFPEVGRFDLAVCLEVAEHLPGVRAASFVADLCDAAPRILFSAAIPHQTGAGHVNCQWQSWWAALFQANGYMVNGSLRFDLWDDDQIEPWYRQNLLLCSKAGENVGPYDVVHPTIHGWGRR